MPSPARPLRVGLTGGIASGKSEVAALFRRAGAIVLDTDLLAREVVRPGEPALKALVTALGPAILAADGSLDRRALRQRLFADAGLRQRVEAILHPAIRSLLDRQSAAAGGPYQVHVIPLLVESGGQNRVDRVLVVDTPEASQVERLMQRDGETEESAQRALAAQATRAERLAIADDVICNDSDLQALERRVAELDRQYRELAEPAGRSR